MDGAAAADAPKPSADDYGALSPAELVAALRSGDAEAQYAAAEDIVGTFEILDDPAIDKLFGAGVVPALLDFVKPDAAGACMQMALVSLRIAVNMGTEYRTKIRLALGAAGCERFWAVVRRHSETGADSEAAVVAMDIMTCLLDDDEGLGTGPSAERNGTALLAVLSKYASFSSESVYSAAALMLKLMSAAHEQRFPLADKPVLIAVSPCLMKFLEPSPGNFRHLEHLFDLLSEFLLIHEPLHIDIRSSGALAAAVSCLALVAERLNRDTAHAAAKAFYNMYLLAPDQSRPRLLNVLCMQPGGLAGLFYGLASNPGVCEELEDDILGRNLNLEGCLMDSHFAMCSLVGFLTPSRSEDEAVLRQRKLHDFVLDFDDGCLAALAAPLPHQRLAAAASAGVWSCREEGARRLFASGDRIELVIDGYLASANRREATGYMKRALHISLQVAVSITSLSRPMTGRSAASYLFTKRPYDARVMANTKRSPLKRSRLATSTLTAADVNVQRRDSTVFVVDGRPFYAAGIIMEKCSAVIADALQNAPAQASVAVPMPADVPAASQYELFGAVVEHAYTGGVTSALDFDSVFHLWCIGDYLGIDVLCQWCCEHLAKLLAASAVWYSLWPFWGVWRRALERSATPVCEIFAGFYLGALTQTRNTSAVEPLANLEKRAPPHCKPSAHMVRVLRAALLRTLAPADEAA